MPLQAYYVRKSHFCGLTCRSGHILASVPSAILALILSACRFAVANPGLHSKWIVSTAGNIITPYNSHSYFDDLAYAAIWLYRLTGDGTYLTAARSYYSSHVSVSDAPPHLCMRQRLPNQTPMSLIQQLRQPCQHPQCLRVYSSGGEPSPAVPCRRSC